MPKYDTLFERLVANTEPPTGDCACWVWKGNRDHRGYGRLAMRVPGKKNPTGVRAHRLMFEIVHEVKLTSDQEVEHLCVNASCVNPDHFDPEPVTKVENLKRQWERRKAMP